MGTVLRMDRESHGGICETVIRTVEEGAVTVAME
jgi:hypothetical protein